MAFTEKQIAQSSPAGTGAASIYSPGTGVTGLIKTIIVANLTGSAANFSLFHDDNGTTYDTTTALYYTVSLAANSTVKFDTYIVVDDDGNFAVQSGTGSALTYTLYGAELS